MPGSRLLVSASGGERNLNFISKAQSIPCLGRVGCWKWGLCGGGGEVREGTGMVGAGVEGGGREELIQALQGNDLVTWAKLDFPLELLRLNRKCD